MILADTSVWIDHLRRPDAELAVAISEGRLAVHRYVIGELALGSIPRRAEFIADLQHLPDIPVVASETFMSFIEDCSLAGSGLGYVDANLLASVASVPGSRLWTRDRRLREQAERLSLAHPA